MLFHISANRVVTNCISSRENFRAPSSPCTSRITRSRCLLQKIKYAVMARFGGSGELSSVNRNAFYRAFAAFSSVSRPRSPPPASDSPRFAARFKKPLARAPEIEITRSRRRRRRTFESTISRATERLRRVRVASASPSVLSSSPRRARSFASRACVRVRVDRSFARRARSRVRARPARARERSTRDRSRAHLVERSRRRAGVARGRVCRE